MNVQLLSYLQLVIWKILLLAHEYIAMFQEEIDNYGIDWDGPVTDQAELNESVDVPELSVILSNEMEQELRQIVDPLWESDCYGLDICMETRQFVETVMEDH